MGAQRKLADPALTVPLENAAPVERAAQVDYQSPRTADGALPASPAILLQEQLAARLAETTAGPTETRGVADVAEVKKWPMPLRIATIVGLSLALWGGVFFAAVAVLT